MKRLITLCVAVVALAACTPSGVGGVGAAPASMDIWAAGDSISVGYAAHFYRPIGVAAVSGASFVYHGTPGYEVNTIGENTLLYASWWGFPRTVVLMGGTNDARYHVPLASIEAAIVTLTDQMSASRVVHVTEPCWTYCATVAPLNAWLLATYPNTVDCAPAVTTTTDGVHPDAAGYGVLATCVFAGVTKVN